MVLELINVHKPKNQKKKKNQSRLYTIHKIYFETPKYKNAKL